MALRGGYGHKRQRDASGHPSQGQSSQRDEIRQQLRLVSEETKELIPLVLSRTQTCSDGFLLEGSDVPRLKAAECPGFTGVKVRDTTAAEHEYGNTCILNMASAARPGGGWLSGASAQEESLCRRSTLPETLKERFYRIPKTGAIYSPSVVIFRTSRESGHKLMALNDPDSLPVVSAISVAALVHPQIKRVGVVTTSTDRDGTVKSVASSRQAYARGSERRAMKEKMRHILRISAYKKHRRIVLGALGCGAFKNPREDTADCWAEVFSEAEFQGGWWKDVVFAILDPLSQPGQNIGNAGAYIQRLDGLAVSAP
ncbi:conserved hypothetical protein [Microsporum canis CBS 113480]|uniref:Microbial-type PARG catalytic domain-containing protein n=1 Tax=Arthroderma otae (strain ATCC MYA-4605 / CBS 113480) TaxID=554155 RepID=C5FVK5_ARTOC|nr:conserved hypothetical protein [Microsporum canis CBS 113480]EEQ33939.1 conserved hypothetical protein [Microsporum canis CBS 113480]